MIRNEVCKVIKQNGLELKSIKSEFLTEKLKELVKIETPLI